MIHLKHLIFIKHAVNNFAVSILYFLSNILYACEKRQTLMIAIINAYANVSDNDISTSVSY